MVDVLRTPTATLVDERHRSVVRYSILYEERERKE
jgi:hypothetical protein